MWMVNPSILCKKHLLGEHLETHMFLGSLKKKIKMNGYIENNLLEPKKLKERHDELAIEMKKRGYNHTSDLKFEEKILEYLDEKVKNYIIDKKASLEEILRRCNECRKRWETLKK
ncbi:MAG: pyrimidine dimer DNA glycosylase/endonuclease V [Candidatus Pacearchaeota archaeon]